MRTLASVLAASTVVAVAGCSGTSRPSPRVGPQMLYVKGDPQFRAGVSQSGTHVGEPWSFGSLVLCARQGEVVVQRVRLVRARGPMRLDAFGLRPDPVARGLLLVGNQPGALQVATDGDARPGPARVAVCSGSSAGSEAAGSELIVQVQRTGPGDGCASALDVDYTVVPRGQGTIRLNLAIGLTQPGSSAGRCE